jgi:hypothetical protein
MTVPTTTNVIAMMIAMTKAHVSPPPERSGGESASKALPAKFDHDVGDEFDERSEQVQGHQGP